MVLWRFTGDRHLVHEHRAPAWSCGVFLADGPLPRCQIHPPPSRRASCRTSVIGIGLTVSPAADAGPWAGITTEWVSGWDRGPPRARAQNYLCAAQAAAVLGLAITAGPNGWWIDPAIRLAIAGIAVWQGTSAPGVVTAAAASGPGGSGSTGNCWPPPPPTTRCAGSPPAPASAPPAPINSPAPR